MSDFCRYNCSERPSTVSPYPDISGIGVVIGYVATAGLVVTIITFAFWAAHDPAMDPFAKDTERENEIHSSSYVPNPVDVIFLTYSPRRNPRSRLKGACLKCVLAMSDLQILTGISILISGFIQLPCGLSAYHWQLLVQLAWFSSVTHLACLTFLRNYLYNRPGERAWRLISMGLFLIMLITAMLPTGYYDWTTDDNSPIEPNASDYAICYFNPAGAPISEAYVSMILSTVSLIFGFFSRVVKLYKYLAVDIIGSIRHTVSKLLRRSLSTVYKKLNLGNGRKPLIRRLAYRPLLAIFLVLRVSADIWTSMTFEVWWLVASFAWGVLNLFQTRRLSAGGSSDWAFGQVVPVLLLAAPLLSLIEYLYPDHSGKEASSDSAPQNDARSIEAVSEQSQAQVRVETMEIDLLENPETDSNSSDHPDWPYYTQSTWMKHFVIFSIVDMLASTLSIIIQSLLSGLDGNNVKLVSWLVPNLAVWTWLPIAQFLALFLFVLFSLLLEDFSKGTGLPLKPDIRQRLLNVLYVVLGGCLLWLAVYPFGPFSEFRVFFIFAFYLLMACCWR